MAAYVFPEATLSGAGIVSYRVVKIDMATQAIASPITVRPDFTTGLITCTANPFIDIPEMTENLEPEIGSFGTNPAKFKCNNILIDGSSRMSDLLTAYDPLSTVWNIRVQIKPVGGSYAFYHWGYIVAEDVVIDKPDYQDPATWIISFESIDGYTLLDEIETEDVLSTINPATGVNPTDTYISYKTALSQSAEILQAINQPYNYTTGVAVHSRQIPGRLYYVKLIDVLQAVSDSMALGTTVNDGAATPHTWRFFSYNGSADIEGDFDDLYVIVSLYVSSHEQGYTFFDSGNYSNASFYGSLTALELLKTICVPFGLYARLKVNGSGNQYLSVEEMEQNSGVSFAADEIMRDVSVKPADRVLYGFKVVDENGAEVVRGSEEDGATAIRNVFLVAQRARNSSYWGQINKTDDINAVYQGLYLISGGNAYSVYKITVRNDSQTGTSGNNITFDYNALPYAADVVGIAASRYYYNKSTAPGTDPIGIYRRRMRRVEFGVKGLVLPSTIGVRQYVTLDGVDWHIREKRWDVRSMKTYYIGESAVW